MVANDGSLIGLVIPPPEPGAGVAASGRAAAGGGVTLREGEVGCPSVAAAYAVPLPTSTSDAAPASSRRAR